MICPRCLNQEEEFFYRVNNQIYCRKCIQFSKTTIDQEIQKVNMICDNQANYHLDFELSQAQAKISHQLKQNYIQCQDSKVNAVCGAGKTEIVFEVIQYVLSRYGRVCFTTPRTELTKELYQRIKEEFKDVTISLVCGGHTDDLNGQLVVCTTHQLYRFYQSFDLLILDEMDAFPYHGNEVLENILHQSVKGQIVYLSATMQDEDALNLTKRYHGYDIPVPRFIPCPYYISLLLCYYHIKQFHKQNKQVLIYVDAKSSAYKVHTFLNKFNVKTKVVHAGMSNIQEILQQLKDVEIDAVVCTTILERGITMKNIQVIVLNATSKIYDRATLIQIAGRVGRKSDYPTGEVLLYGVYKTKAIKECINQIRKDNV